MMKCIVKLSISFFKDFDNSDECREERGQFDFGPGEIKEKNVSRGKIAATPLDYYPISTYIYNLGLNVGLKVLCRNSPLPF